ncbi:hypothetical protein ABIE27_000916 [Paenibacillus sp. 4624]|jgi:hypothetical protein|uniref:Uncharacterized protein n=1 Tax=Paenibacillus amylolyticus TaxID=1451 RepID=A0A5M9WQY5_PAEAM|nr:hypothetical protein [Paenibacillus amylolyticus]KAA8783943.1 hypothetical protein EC604_08790 [Paenibacillus amylolyticus]
MKRALINLISALLFNLLLAICSYVPLEKRLPNSSYSSFSDTYLLFFLYSFPLYFVLGYICSVVFDKLKMQTRGVQFYLGLVITYALAICISFASIIIFLNNEIDNKLVVLLFCFLGAVLHGVVSAIFRFKNR